MTQIDYQSLPPRRPDLGLPAILAWILIVLIAIALPVLNHVSQRFAPAEAGGGGADVLFQISGQYTLGAARAIPEQRAEFLQQFEAQAKTPSQRAAAAVLREAASTQPTSMPAAESPGPVHFDTGDRLDAAAHPWFADLSVPGARRDAAVEKADRVFSILVVVAIAGLLVGAIALTLGITAVILLATGGLKPVFVRPAGPVGVYVEAFAAYLVLFIAGSLGVSLALPDAPLAVKVMPMGVVVLFAMLWPALRGVNWGVYRRDIGLHAGKGVFTEIGAGIVGYLACLPLLGASLLVVLILQRFVEQQASHPIVDEIVGTHPIWILLLAAVFAPITEELMFRGLLHTHLRARFRVFPSAIINGLIFAAIHPQGWLAIPTLLTIACILSLLREWRGSLIAPVTAHAMNNGVVVLMLLGMARV